MRHSTSGTPLPTTVRRRKVACLGFRDTALDDAAAGRDAWDLGEALWNHSAARECPEVDVVGRADHTGLARVNAHRVGVTVSPDRGAWTCRSG